MSQCPGIAAYGLARQVIDSRCHG